MHDYGRGLLEITSRVVSRTRPGPWQHEPVVGVMRARTAILVLAAFGVGGCYSGVDDGRASGSAGLDDDGGSADDDGGGTDGDEPISEDLEPAEARLRLLLSRQYVHAVRDLFGEAAAAEAAPPENHALNGFDAIGASQLALGDAEVDAFERSGQAVAEVAIADTARLVELAGCTPTGPTDQACMESFVAALGRRAFRRPLTAEELDRYVAVGTTAASDFGDAYAGFERVIATILQSPYFLYQVEVGEPDPDAPGRRRLTGWEMATRMSFFLVDTIPDPALLDAAEAGELDTAAGIREQAERLLAAPEARQALADFVSEYLRLRDLPTLPKDPVVFPEYGESVAIAMQLETLALVEELAWNTGGDFTEIFDAPYTFINADLAPVYGLDPAAYGSQLTKVTLPAEQKRGGIFGHASFLALLGHVASTSPTIRGKFIRENIMCTAVPPPPPGVVTDLPDTSEAQTMRERLEQHMEDPSCAGCHSITDPIGFGLELYDGIGRFRTTENGAMIDATSELDGSPFEGAAELGAIVRQNPLAPSCIVRSLFRHATGHIEEDGEKGELAAIEESFAEDGFRMQSLLAELVASPAFRVVGEPQ